MSIKKYTLANLIVFASHTIGKTQDFSRHFADSTLRVDYTFSGKQKSVHISADEFHLLPKWHGRRVNLDSLALAGTGRITMLDSATRQVIYRTSFSSLFQEWLSTEEASQRAMSFENVFLLPYPRQTTLIQIELDNLERKQIAKEEFYFSPKDILVHNRSEEKPLPHTYLHKAKHNSHAIDIAILAEGYRKEEMQQFLQSASTAAKELLSYAPFSKHKDYINIIAVESPSIDSGVSEPHNNIWRQTAFSSHFDTFYSERYLTSKRVKSIHNALINIPYEHIIIIANTDTYGGGGIYNSYTLSSVHPKHFLPVVVHEFGHSFGGLADEYFYETDLMNNFYNLGEEPWEQNITSLKDFSGKKWSNLIKKGTPIPTPKEKEKEHGVGVYEGAAYTAKGLYKATEDCRMRTNTFPTFCPACHQALEQLILYYLPKKLK